MPQILNVPRWVIWVALALGLALLIALVVGMQGTSRFTARDFPGSLVLSIPTPWTAPSGEVVQGLVRYTPMTGEVEYVLSPDRASGLRLVGFSSERDEILAVQQGDESALIRLTTADQKETLIATVPFEQSIGIGDWSPHGRQVAFGSFSSTTTPEIHMVTANGTASSLGDGMPLGFSSDGETLLAYTPSGYTVFDLDGSHRPVEGLLVPKTFPDLRWSSSRTYFSFQEMGDSIQLYHMNWATGVVTAAGTVEIFLRGGYGFGSNDTFVVINPDLLTVYTLSPGGPTVTASYAGSYPPGALLFAEEKL